MLVRDLHTMTDPSNALRSFQHQFRLGRIPVRAGAIDKFIFCFHDTLLGQERFTYVTLNRKTVTAFVNFAFVEPIDGKPCLSIGYAVPQPYRNQGRAKKAAASAILEIQNLMSERGCSTFYVEAIVGTENEASKCVAAAVISDTPKALTDDESGLPALQYVRKLQTFLPQGDKS